MNVICFGDSNTYGYDPRGYFGGRYDAGSRWVDMYQTMEAGDVVLHTTPSGKSSTIKICYQLGKRAL